MYVNTVENEKSNRQTWADLYQVNALVKREINPIPG